jgi:pimeloyl-ACP methyl ester carboxylesterase
MTAELQVPTVRSTVRSRGLDLAVCEWGDVEGARLLLIAAHGFLDCAQFFAPLAAELLRDPVGIAMVALSFAGHGDSDWAGAYGWRDFTADLLAVTRAARARAAGVRMVGLVGHSFGGVQVLDLAAEFPDIADFVVNLDAPAGPVRDGAVDLVGALRDAVRRDGSVQPLPVYPDLEGLVTRRRINNPRLAPEVLRSLVPFLARPVGDGWTWSTDPLLVGRLNPWELSGAPVVDPLTLAARVPRPVLMVTGAAEDHPDVRGRFPGDAAIVRVPNIRHERLADAGHYVHVECPAATAGAVIDFVDRLRAERGPR